MELPRDREVLRTLPLHTITQQYGQGGLEERFRLELERFDPAERAFIQSAGQLAVQVHADQRRSNEPYANHVLRVGIRVMSQYHFDVDDPHVIAGGFLHDSLEDQLEKLAAMARRKKPTLFETATQTLHEKFGEETTGIVRALTNPEFDKSKDWMLAYKEHVWLSLNATPKAIPDKVSDTSENASGILYSPPQRIQHFATKYSPMIPLYRKLIVLPEAPFKPEIRVKLLKQMDVTEARFEAILASQEV